MAGQLIEFFVIVLKKAYHGPQFGGTCVKHRGVQFHRIRKCTHMPVSPLACVYSQRRLTWSLDAKRNEKHSIGLGSSPGKLACNWLHEMFAEYC